MSRLHIIQNIRHGIAANAECLLDLFPSHLVRTREESITAELLPLADACRFLELNAERILRRKRVSKRGRPLWMSRVDVEVVREPVGVVLIIGPSNYPLFLPGVQIMQALAAGNSIIVKPGRGGSALMQKFRTIAIEAGLPACAFRVLDEDPAEAIAAIRAGVDKVVITGSVETGRAILREAAETVTPVTAELSGFDPVFILPSADIKRAIAAIRFGRTLNGGETCIAPRRIFVHASIASQFRAAFEGQFEEFGSEVAQAAACEFALGASIFGEENEAREFARKLSAGVVVINDIIVPTADPRVPFGGRRLSGFGTTRGAQGLLEMTSAKAVVVQRAKRLRHVEPPIKNAAALFLGFLAAVHARSYGDKYRGLTQIFKAIYHT